MGQAGRNMFLIYCGTGNNMCNVVRKNQKCETIILFLNKYGIKNSRCRKWIHKECEENSKLLNIKFLSVKTRRKSVGVL